MKHMKNTAEAGLGPAATARSRCIWWLSSQCHGQGCRCVPALPSRRQRKAAPKPQETTP